MSQGLNLEGMCLYSNGPDSDLASGVATGGRSRKIPSPCMCTADLIDVEDCANPTTYNFSERSRNVCLVQLRSTELKTRVCQDCILYCLQTVFTSLINGLHGRNPGLLRRSPREKIVCEGSLVKRLFVVARESSDII
jgi:hypothetical protein